MLYFVRIISDTCTLHLGKGSGKSSQNPSWNKGRAVIGSSGKAVILLITLLCYGLACPMAHAGTDDDDDDVFMITHQLKFLITFTFLVFSRSVKGGRDLILIF